MPDLAGLDLDVRRLAARAAEGLVDHDAGVRQGEATAFLTGREQDGAHAHRVTDADGRHGAADVLHGVVDREAGVDHAAGAVHVELDVLVRVLALEEQELADDDVRDVVVHVRAEEDDAVLQQAAEQVPRALAAVGRLVHLRKDDHAASLFALQHLHRLRTRLRSLDGHSFDSPPVHLITRDDERTHKSHRPAA